MNHLGEYARRGRFRIHLRDLFNTFANAVFNVIMGRGIVIDAKAKFRRGRDLSARLPDAVLKILCKSSRAK